MARFDLESGKRSAPVNFPGDAPTSALLTPLLPQEVEDCGQHRDRDLHDEHERWALPVVRQGGPLATLRAAGRPGR